jgi:hypothetical protein
MTEFRIAIDRYRARTLAKQLASPLLLVMAAVRLLRVNQARPSSIHTLRIFAILARIEGNLAQAPEQPLLGVVARRRRYRIQKLDHPVGDHRRESSIVRGSTAPPSNIAGQCQARTLVVARRHALRASFFEAPRWRQRRSRYRHHDTVVFACRPCRDVSRSNIGHHQRRRAFERIAEAAAGRAAVCSISPQD